MVRVAINGFGRIGRLVFRILQDRKDIEVVAINDLVALENLAYLLEFDTVHGRFNKDITIADDGIVVDGKKTLITAEKDPTHLPWKELNIDYVIESTGRYTKLEEANAHITAGAKRVLVSAPGKDGMPMFVMGVNHKKYDPKIDRVVSNASCTTNCLAPMTKVLLDNFGIEEGLMTTVHALTSSQPTVDGPSKKDLRGGRCASYNIIPSSTGAAKAVGVCIPEIKGKLTGMAFRVPVADVSVVDLTVKISKDSTYDEIAKAMKEASQGELKGILDYTEKQVVSSDFIGSSFSSIFDKLAGIGLSKRFFKLIAWYDNEMGYSHRIVDFIKYMSSRE